MDIAKQFPSISDSLYANSRTLDIGNGCCPILRQTLSGLGCVYLIAFYISNSLITKYKPVAIKSIIPVTGMVLRKMSLMDT